MYSISSLIYCFIQYLSTRGCHFFIVWVWVCIVFSIFLFFNRCLLCWSCLIHLILLRFYHCVPLLDFFYSIIFNLFCGFAILWLVYTSSDCPILIQFYLFTLFWNNYQLFNSKNMSIFPTFPLEYLSNIQYFAIW